MVEFKGYEKLIESVYRNGQEDVFAYWDSLDDSGKRRLLDELASVDFGQTKQMFDHVLHMHANQRIYGCAPYISQKSIHADKAMANAVRKSGEEALCSGKVAAFVVAGGQGSRLGFNGPKGVLEFSPVKNKTLFQVHSEKIKMASVKYGVAIPFLVMTSQSNHAQTADYFEKNNFFGLGKDNVFIFPQNMIPSVDTRGKLILESAGSIFRNPDGHGGSLTAMRTSGILDKLKARGIETISYFQVDNPLVKIIDPLFIGYHCKYFADVSSKALIKTDPDEKIGIFVKYENTSMGIVEYSDLSQENKSLRGEDGSLVYSAGNLAIHLFDVEFLEQIAGDGDISLPYHAASKKIKKYTADGIVEIDGYKFEKFVFDALPLTDKNIVVETFREEEFAPIKNKDGADSIESARKLCSDLFRRWLVQKGISIPEKVKWIEISPLTAAGPEDLPSDLTIPDQENVYL